MAGADREIRCAGRGRLRDPRRHLPFRDRGERIGTRRDGRLARMRPADRQRHPDYRRRGAGQGAPRQGRGGGARRRRDGQAESRAAMKMAKRQAREVALQALYAWQLSHGDALEQMKALDGYEGADQKLAENIVRGVLERGHELAITTDMLVEGRHFLPGAEARALGHKALAVSLSDLAACGATPRWITLAVALPSADERWLKGFSEGLFALADRHGIALIGGDTTRGPLAIDITALGEVPA